MRGLKQHSNLNINSRVIALNRFGTKFCFVWPQIPSSKCCSEGSYAKEMHRNVFQEHIFIVITCMSHSVVVHGKYFFREVNIFDINAYGLKIQIFWNTHENNVVSFLRRNTCKTSTSIYPTFATILHLSPTTWVK